MKVIKVIHLVKLVEEFEKLRGQNYAFSNAYDYYVSDTSGVSYIERLKVILAQALKESKGKNSAYISRELFVKYRELILDKSLNPESLAYKVFFGITQEVVNINRFIRDLTKRYYRKDYTQLPYFSNLVISVAETKTDDLTWEALRRLERADITLSHDEMAMILENRECAMGLAMAFAEFSFAANRKTLMHRFADAACEEDSELAKHLLREEDYNYRHFDLHPNPITEKALGIIGGIKVMRTANKEFEVEDLEAMLSDLDACAEYAQAVKLLYADSYAFDEDCRDKMLPILRSQPARALYMMAATIHVRKLQEQECVDQTCLTSDDLENLQNDHLSTFAALLKALPDELNNSDNVVALHDQIKHGVYLLTLLPCLRVKGGADIQTLFDLLMENAHHACSMLTLPILAEYKSFTADALSYILKNSEHAASLINGLMVWAREMDKYEPKHRSSVVRYSGVLQDSGKQLVAFMFDTKMLMFRHPAIADKIAQAAIVHIGQKNKFSRLVDIEDLLNLRQQQPHSPFMFRKDGSGNAVRGGVVLENSADLRSSANANI